MAKTDMNYAAEAETLLNDVIRLLEVSASTASRTLRKMVKNNLLKQNGKVRSTNYTVVK